MQKALKVNEAITKILEDELLQNHIDEIYIIYTCAPDKNVRKILFKQRHSVPQRLYISINYNRHILWKKGEQGDILSENLFPKLLQYTSGGNHFILPKNKLSTMSDIDSCIKQFLIDGYMMILPSVYSTNDSFHSEVYNVGQELVGHRILDTPFLNQIIRDPAVVTVLSRLLGQDYFFDSTDSRMHLSQRGRKDQHWHRDDFREYKRLNYFQAQLTNVMAMYYPQDTIKESGPTQIRRGSHLCCNSISYVPDRLVFEEQRKYYEQSMVCPAGSIVLMHYDLVHRRAANTLADRFMFKMMFRRTKDPHEYSETAEIPNFNDVKTLDDDHHADCVSYAKELWCWMYNQKNESNNNVRDLIDYTTW
ncbi:hypothetical protein AKO1_001275 [Acrasis kona]|uniref:Phytanoyl-CoA dioxygenase n=1 Tax=Acrasis kona TaxID=1008807 RepID=A0AAW2ZE43_9EUKA